MKLVRLTSAFSVTLFFAASPVRAQIARPQLGYMLDLGGALRPMFGVAGAATLGDPAVGSAISFACSARFCLAKTDTALIGFAPGVAGGGQSVPVSSSFAALCDTCAGPAIIALDEPAGSGDAWIYFQASQQLARWQDGVLKVLDSMPGDFTNGGEILSLRAAAGGFDYAIARRGLGRGAIAPETATVWIEHYSTSDGSVAVIDSLDVLISGDAPAVLLLDGGVLMSLPDQLVLRRADGQALTFPLAGASAFYAAADGYVEIAASGGRWILRTDAGREQLAMLPGTSTGAGPGAITRPTRGARQ